MDRFVRASRSSSMNASSIKAVALDVFGTLLFIGERRQPYRTLFERLSVNFSEGARRAMTQNVSLTGLADQLSGSGRSDAAAVASLEAEVAAEIESVRSFPEVAGALADLRTRGFRLALISNLAAPYARAVEEKLPPIFDARVYSFAVGAVKPEPAIFAVLSERLCLPPDQILVVGNSRRDDVGGARRFGMNALHLDRRPGAPEAPNVVPDLNALVRWLDNSAPQGTP